MYRRHTLCTVHQGSRGRADVFLDHNLNTHCLLVVAQHRTLEAALVDQVMEAAARVVERWVADWAPERVAAGDWEAPVAATVGVATVTVVMAATVVVVAESADREEELVALEEMADFWAAVEALVVLEVDLEELPKYPVSFCSCPTVAVAAASIIAVADGPYHVGPWSEL